MADFSKFILITDLDGTLVSEKLQILDKDKASIKRFVEGGGLMAVSTGRAMSSAKQFVDQITVNLPCMFFNGGTVCDLYQDKTYHTTYMPDGARECLTAILEKFPNICAAVLRDNNYYNVTERHDGKTPFALDGIKTIEADKDTLEYPWYKILFNVMEYDMQEVIAFAATLQYPGLSFLGTTTFYYEMMPAGISKASGLKKLLEIIDAKDRTIVAIGDYYNDAEMIEMADIGVTVANAPDDIKKLADIVVCSVDDGALSETIDYIAKL